MKSYPLHSIKKYVLAFSVIIAMYLLLSGELSQVLNEAGRSAVWLAKVYVASLGVFFLGLVMMVGSAGKALKHRKSSRLSVKGLANSLSKGWLAVYGFWLNAIGAVIAALSLIVAIIVSLPVSRWVLLVAPVLDLLSTVVIRYGAYRLSRPATAKRKGRQ